jgi:uncharacterized protein YjdB
MKTVYGKLANLIAALIVGMLLFAPMRFGNEDYLYAHPRSIRMSPGDSYALSYRLDSRDPSQRVVYSSANETVAAVDDSGRVTAIAPGKTQILLDSESGARARVQIEVVSAHISTLTLNTDRMAMEKGQVSGLKAIFDDKADNTLVQWSSEDENVARVDAVGRVSAVGGGRTRITATAVNGLTASTDISVHVTGNAMRITPEEVSVGVGATLVLGADYIPADTTDEVASWASSDQSVLSVQRNGTLRAVSEGQAVLSAFSREGLSASTVVRVEPPVADFEISPTAATIKRGDALTLEPRFFDAQGNVDANSSSHLVTWTSSNPAIATVEDGVVTALKSGSARISAAADGKIASSVISVQTIVEEVRLDMHQIYVLREQTVMPIQLQAEIIPSDADDTRLTWSADNDLVATVNQRGLIDLVGGYGTATITVRAKSGAEDHFVVNVVSELPEGAENN